MAQRTSRWLAWPTADRYSDIAVAHDYLTQRGGAERVVLSMLKAFPQAPVFTALYEQPSTYPEFVRHEIRPSVLNRSRSLREHHRRALPILAPVFSALHADADVLICSSSGWAHGARTTGRKIVYCHTPARWLYRMREYLPLRSLPSRAAMLGLGPMLRRWDRKAAQSGDLYVANSRAVRDRIRLEYGIDADILPPPPALEPAAPRTSVPGVEPGFFLCVARLLPYKNVGAVVAAIGRDDRLVIVGDGPERARLTQSCSSRVRFLSGVPDDQLRWLYANCLALIAASYEDYGLTPLEAASFGRPSVVLRAGGYLDTMVEDETAIFFEEPDARHIGRALERVKAHAFSPVSIVEHANKFSEERFVERIRGLVANGRTE